GQPPPPFGVGAVRSGIGLEDFRAVMVRINGERDEKHIILAGQIVLELDQASADHLWAAGATAGEDERGYPDLAQEVGPRHGAAVLSGQGKVGDGIRLGSTA